MDIDVKLINHHKMMKIRAYLPLGRAREILLKFDPKKTQNGKEQQ